MPDAFTRTPFFGLTLIFVCWVLGVKLQKKTGWLLCNPVLTSSLMIVVILTVLGVPLKHFNAGGSVITMLLGPATAVLALNIYQQRKVLQENFLPVLAGCVMGSLVSIVAALTLCHLFETNSVFSASMLPKSVTTAIALGISENGGGIPGITAGAVVITGIEGAVIAPYLAKLFHIKDPVAEGVAIGACSHAVGTSKALEIGKIQGAMSSISLCVCGIITTGLALIFM
ncbi:MULTISPECIES: LrgB family protein [Acidaminococcus]|uniref:LrgB family protein n=1 Tax=Acidaminococcus TaxID=904 RepID=UPI0026659C3E|nr:LrgB family protein [Acidaminococcus sp.]MDO5598510.1 LrgB family protein [Acidaminococcus sp.]